LDKGAYRVTFSPDGKLLAIANSDGTAWLWDLAADHRVGAPIPVDPGGAVNDVAFSPNGKLLATAEDDGTARLWDSATGRPVGIPIPADPAGAVHGVAFSPDGKLLATAEDDGTARLWEVAQFTDPYHALCADVGPPTREVWNEYSQGAPFRKICVNQG
jgi:WD40 repeat protein